MTVKIPCVPEALRGRSFDEFRPASAKSEPCILPVISLRSPRTPRWLILAFFSFASFARFAVNRTGFPLPAITRNYGDFPTPPP